MVHVRKPNIDDLKLGKDENGSYTWSAAYDDGHFL